MRAAFQGSAAQVRCVRLWHHNLPSLRVRVEMRNAAGEWEALPTSAIHTIWTQVKAEETLYLAGEVPKSSKTLYNIDALRTT